MATVVVSQLWETDAPAVIVVAAPSSDSPTFATVPVVVMDTVTVCCTVPPLLGDANVMLTGLKLAVTVTGAFPINVHGAVPVQPPPLHPSNEEPDAGVAVKVTGLPALYAAEHVAPQLMPAGELVTVPEPLPVLLTVTTKPPPAIAHASLEYGEEPLVSKAWAR